jgi:uncharacterized iron-regulated protein
VKTFLQRTLLISIIGLLFSGCAKRVTPLWVSKVSILKEPIGPEEIFRFPDGERVSFFQLMGELHLVSVIFVGENHDQIKHHDIQVKLLQGLREMGKEVVVAMEMFERSQQSVLDRWSYRLLTEKGFLEEVKWDMTWGMDYHLYKGILDEIRDQGLKLLGLNIERDLIRKVAENGIEGLSREDRGKLPEMDLADGQHRRYILSIYKSHHGGSAKDFENFYQAQCLWDEAMAETLFRFLQSPEGSGKTVVVLAGNGHVVFDFGIPKRFYRRGPAPYKTIMLKEWKKIEEDFAFTGNSSPPADFLWITEPNPPEKKRPRIGVMLKEREDAKGLWIEKVIPESPAEKAGFLPGDQVVAVEGKESTKVKDIHEAFSQKGWGKELTFTILREGLKKEITIMLPSLED